MNDLFRQINKDGGDRSRGLDPKYRPENTEHCLEQPDRDLTNYVPDPDLICPKTNLLTPWGPSIWVVDGPEVSYYGSSYSTRMVVACLSEGGGAWIWSPVPFTKAIAYEIEGRAGCVRHIISPNKYHNLNLKEWSDNHPLAKVHAAPGLAERESIVQDLTLDFVLTDDIYRDLSLDFDQVLFRGSYCDEAVFYHRLSGTVIFADLIQRNEECKCHGVMGTIMKANGVIGSNGGTPQSVRFSFWWNGQKRLAQNALRVILDKWKPNKMIVAHGSNAQENATEIVSRALEWIDSPNM